MLLQDALAGCSFGSLSPYCCGVLYLPKANGGRFFIFFK